MMRTAVLAFALLAGCDSVRDFYDREYVLYDPAVDEAAASRPTEAEPADADARIAELEAELEGLDRAIRAGLDENGALARRRAAVESELVELRRD